MKILKHCLLLGTVLCMPMTVEAAATSEPVEIVRLQGQLPAPLSPTHIELFKLAESGDLDAKEIFFQRFMNGAVSFAFREKFDISKLLPQTDDLSSLSEASLYVASREWKKISDSFVNFIRNKALEGNTNAQGIMGFLYSNGKCVSQNQDEGASWYRKAIISGNSGIAYNNLAYAIATKEVLPVSGEDRDDLSEKAMKNGFVGAISFKKLAAQEVYLLQAAQAGRSEAERELGIRLIEEDRDKEAYPFLARAFDQGEDLLNFLIKYLAQEAEEAGEIDRAIELYIKAAEKGSASAWGSLSVLYSQQGKHAKSYEAFNKQCNLLKFGTILGDADLFRKNANVFLKTIADSSMSYFITMEMDLLIEALKLPKLIIGKDEGYNFGYFERGAEKGAGLPLTDENIATLLELSKSLEQRATDGDAVCAYRFGLFNAIGLFPDSTLSQALKYLQLADAANIPGSKRALAHLALRLSLFEKSREQGQELLKAAGEYADIASTVSVASSSSTVSVASSSSTVEETPIKRESVGEFFRIARAAYSTESWPLPVYISYSEILLPWSDIPEVQQVRALLAEKSRGKTKDKKGAYISFESQMKQGFKLFSKNRNEEAVKNFTQALGYATKSASSIPWNFNLLSWIARENAVLDIKTEEYVGRTEIKMVTQLLAECHLLGVGTPQNFDLAVMFAEQSHVLFANFSDALFANISDVLAH